MTITLNQDVTAREFTTDDERELTLTQGTELEVTDWNGDSIEVRNKENQWDTSTLIFKKDLKDIGL